MFSLSKTVSMYRPCSQKELDLVAASGYRRWPPRLPEQPIFYPVTNKQYALEVNRWNVSQFGKGYVTKFEVNRTFAEQYEIQQVGASHHTEWWILAEDLDTLNQNIVGLIQVIAEDPEVVIRHDGLWDVWREDIYGNRFKISGGLRHEDATRIVDEYEAKGHKQHYWMASEVARKQS